ncbi:MAG: Holliday junction branch migration protein RuvA [Dehalococcoidia bacterium]
MVIAGIEGILKSRGNDHVVVDVGGISFRIHAPTSTLSLLGASGQRVQLQTHLQVREDSLTLYGFATTDELRLFELLVSVSGVGPKVALAILSALTPEQFVLAVSTGNGDLLTSITGVGKKTAARILLELRGKFEEAPADIPHPHEDVRSALISLGYSAAEALSAIATIPSSPDLTLEDRIMLALKYFAKVG